MTSLQIMTTPTTSLCQYFGTCGGCMTQHLSYELQLQNKKKALEHALSTFANNVEVQVFADKEYFYRNRMDFIFHAKGLGFREKYKSFFTVDIEKCVIANEKLNTLLKEIRTFFAEKHPSEGFNAKEIDAYDPKKRSGTFRYAVIRTPQNDESISFVLNSNSPRISAAVELIKEFSQTTTAKNIIVTYVPGNTDHSTSEEYFVVKGTDVLKEIILEKTFQYNVQGFFQNNFTMAEKMHKYVNDLLKTYDAAKAKQAYLLDLYAGVGTFGIINAELFKSVTIIEAFAGCVKAAEENIKINNIKNASAQVLDAKHLRRLFLENKKPLFVITDPPRTGMDMKTIEQLKELKPEVMIYISCNVEQLAKDILKFKTRYDVKSAALFDLFPQTNHSEAVVEFVLKK
ncbi:23S rRNA (uracil(1939)-C(5))-methyltransferase RlmD [Candidatus Woesearchaeota archaeon]|nr:23S rRNA (uracil(1939)-C(5))-methyltransferase RlmD [Candidatus Woesearchaeota archaeon]